MYLSVPVHPFKEIAKPQMNLKYYPNAILICDTAEHLCLKARWLNIK